MKIPTKNSKIIERVQERVAAKFALTTEELASANSRRDVVIPRQIAIYLAKQVTDASLPEIGACFGGKHPTTVMHSIAKIHQLRETDQNLRTLIEELSQTLRNERQHSR